MRAVLSDMSRSWLDPVLNRVAAVATLHKMNSRNDHFLDTPIVAGHKVMIHMRFPTAVNYPSPAHDSTLPLLEIDRLNTVTNQHVVRPENLGQIRNHQCIVQAYDRIERIATVYLGTSNPRVVARFVAEGGSPKIPGLVERAIQPLPEGVLDAHAGYVNFTHPVLVRILQPSEIRTASFDPLLSLALVRMLTWANPNNPSIEYVDYSHEMNFMAAIHREYWNRGRTATTSPTSSLSSQSDDLKSNTEVHCCGIMTPFVRLPLSTIDVLSTAVEPLEDLDDELEKLGTEMDTEVTL